MNYIKKKIGYIGSKEIYLISFTNDNNFTISFYSLGGYVHSVLIPYKNNPNKYNTLYFINKTHFPHWNKESRNIILDTIKCCIK